jgi:hypothetical protein
LTAVLGIREAREVGRGGFEFRPVHVGRDAGAFGEAFGFREFFLAGEVAFDFQPERELGVRVDEEVRQVGHAVDVVSLRFVVPRDVEAVHEHGPTGFEARPKPVPGVPGLDCLDHVCS